MRDREREREAETQAEGEAGSMQGAHVGLNPRTPGSRPEPMADAHQLSPPGARELCFIRQSAKRLSLDPGIHMEKHLPGEAPGVGGGRAGGPDPGSE